MKFKKRLEIYLLLICIIIILVSIISGFEYRRMDALSAESVRYESNNPAINLILSILIIILVCILIIGAILEIILKIKKIQSFKQEGESPKQSVIYSKLKIQ